MSKLLPFDLFIRQALLYPLTSPFLPAEDKVKKNHSYAAGRLIGSLEAAAPYGIPKTGQTVEYREGDDGDLEIGKPDTPPRFTDNEDGTITDNATGLMWPKDGNGAGCNNGNTLLWPAAIDWAIGLDFAGHADWRLPNLKELMSIVDYGRYNPCIDVAYFPNTTNDYYWTSSTSSGNANDGWYVTFSFGVISGFNKTAQAFDVRAVRGPVS